MHTAVTLMDESPSARPGGAPRAAAAQSPALGILCVSHSHAAASASQAGTIPSDTSIPPEQPPRPEACPDWCYDRL